MTSSVSITVAIPTYGRDQVLVDTIRHVLTLVPPPTEVVVLDQTKEHVPEVARTLETIPLRVAREMAGHGCPPTICSLCRLRLPRLIPRHFRGTSETHQARVCDMCGTAAGSKSANDSVYVCWMQKALNGFYSN